LEQGRMMSLGLIRSSCSPRALKSAVAAMLATDRERNLRQPNANWMDWRALWEWGQAANGLAQFVGFAALVAS
jgi:hypothetical protein